MYAEFSLNNKYTVWSYDIILRNSRVCTLHIPSWHSFVAVLVYVGTVNALVQTILPHAIAMLFSLRLTSSMRCWLPIRGHEYVHTMHTHTLTQMFFINRGTVEVVSEDGSVVFATMNEGKFFGEISLVFSCPRTASIRYLNKWWNLQL